MSDLPELVVPDQPSWHEWLDAHHSAEGVWLVLAKKGTTEPTSLTYEQALDEALCYGWIDGQVGRRDELTYRQRFTPRRPRSAWSKRNVGKCEQLIADGRMRPSGREQIERAKADGRWEVAYHGSAESEMPEDLATAIAASPRAQAMFDILTSQNRYALIFRTNDARRPETRARRIRQFVEMLERGETPHPQKRTL